MAIFEVSREYLEEFVDLQIEKNKELDNFREELIDVLAYNSPDQIDFMLEDIENETSWPYEKKEPTQLYVRDSRYHIRIKDLVVDFFENVFTGALLEAMLFLFGTGITGTGESVGITKDFILFVKRVIKEYVIRLDNTEFCIYLQAISHFREKQEFSVEEMKEWLPLDEKICNMHTDKWICPNREDDVCNFSIDLLDIILKKMELKNIIDDLGNSIYKIRY